MHTGRIQLIHILIGALFLGGCGLRPCQAPLDEVPRSLTQYPWKLVSTNDQDVKRKLTFDTFLIYQFTSNSTGTMKSITLNNEPDEDSTDQLRPFQYRIPNRNQNVVCITYRTEPDNEFCYSYSLSRTGMRLTDLGTSENYIFRDYRGAIAPDDNCKP
jgi:hypothetical protein